jgi:hypothetical protein
MGVGEAGLRRVSDQPFVYGYGECFEILFAVHYFSIGRLGVDWDSWV